MLDHEILLHTLDYLLLEIAIKKIFITVKFCTQVSDKMVYANSANLAQTAPEGAVWSGPTLFAVSQSTLRNNA